MRLRGVRVQQNIQPAARIILQIAHSGDYAVEVSLKTCFGYCGAVRYGKTAFPMR